MRYTAAGLEEAHPDDLRQTFPRLGQQALLPFPQAAGPGEVTCQKVLHVSMKIKLVELKKALGFQVTYGRGSVVRKTPRDF